MESEKVIYSTPAQTSKLAHGFWLKTLRHMEQHGWQLGHIMQNQLQNDQFMSAKYLTTISMLNQ